MAEQDPSSSAIPNDVRAVVFDQFAGINTKPSRNGIDDKEMFWCDGFMPLGPRNLRTLYDIGPAIFTTPDDLSIIWYNFANIKAAPYGIVLLSDGSLVAFNTNTGMTTQLLTAGGITSVSSNSIGLSQFGSQYIIIVTQQPNGFFIWDGTNLFTNGTIGPDVDIFQDGNGYTSQPTISTVGGSGSGASFIATLQNGHIAGITVTNPGMGFQSTDNVILTFTGGGSSGTTAVLTATLTSGSITAIAIAAGGASYQNPVITVLDSSGIGASIVAGVGAGGAITSTTISHAGSGYTNPQFLIEDPNSPVAVATVDIMPQGVSGTTAEVYTSRLFIGNGPITQITAPGTLVNFAASDGGDTFTSTDSFLRVGYTKFQQSNGFLYLIADSSVNYISGIQTTGSPPSTTFTNQNADPEIGTPYQPAAVIFGENLIFANAFGIHAGFGGSFTKISDPLDGFYASVPNFAGITPSAAKAIIFGRRVWMLLLPVIDQITGRQVNKLLMTDGKIWWTSQQSINLTFIAPQEINSVLTAWGTDGRTIHRLFQTPSTTLTKTAQSKLWDNPGGYLVRKTINRIWGGVDYFNPDEPAIVVSIDSDVNNSANVPISLGDVIPVINTFGTEIPVQNVLGQTVDVFSGRSGIVVFPPQACGQWGTLVGLTVTTNCADCAIISISLDTLEDEYRG